ncbi:MAG: L-glutamate gamma-semialdehyde dehydrogenase [Alphaproteobacteria bacterium]|nr:MAG: L-glutamate gamma-semialdehyde dehydrogenase [Alphaproteobacteria bacterium]
MLPYLVRRLLENGANSSFVNQLLDHDVKADILAADPIEKAKNNQVAANPHLSRPRDLFNGQRLSACGVDLTQMQIAHKKQAAVRSKAPIYASSIVAGEDVGDRLLEIVNPAKNNEIVGTAKTVDASCIHQAVISAARCPWHGGMSANERADCLFAAADRLEEEIDDFLRLCVLEAGKTIPDAVAEVREAVDFFRYYALQALSPRIAARKPLGVVACISPWNFPLAIFLGQIAAALSVGNSVVAKPAEQTPLISYRAIKLLQAAGVPADAVQLLLGDGAALGNALTRHPDVAGICFTGSTATAKRIAFSLAETGRGDVPLISETGGINAMIVDSTALLEQAVQDVVASAFQSAGQRCSACRIVCVQNDIADAFIAMLSGAMRELKVADPAVLSTDVGPVIDANAHAMIARYVTELSRTFDIVGQAPDYSGPHGGFFSTPVAFEVSRVEDVKKEVFGPVLHVVRFSAGNIESMIEDINNLGYGLTMGLHTRIDNRVRRIVDKAHIGNIYVNRNQIGAVVGVQPFGGEGLSGTGPKAGGPHYLLRLTHNHRTVDSRLSNAVEWELPEPNDLKRAEKAVLKARRVARIWAKTTTPSERFDCARRALEGECMEAGKDLPDIGVERSTLLPGPTGETNTLTLHPRGVLLCFGGENAHILTRQILLALAAGNGVLIASTPGTRPCLDQIGTLIKALPTGLLSTLADAEAVGLIDADIDGVVIDGPHKAAIAARLCRRSGPILPVLSAFDEPERFYHERTLTINTTAAGGNASLLAMS